MRFELMRGNVDGKGGWKNHREDTTDWNDKGNVEIWRAAWAAYTLSSDSKNSQCYIASIVH